MDFSKFPNVDGIDTRSQNALLNGGITFLDFADLMSEGYYSAGHRKIRSLPNLGKKSFKSLCEFYEKHRDEIAETYGREMQSFDADGFLESVVDLTKNQFISETAGVFHQMKYQYRAMIEKEIQNLIREKIKSLGVEDMVVSVVEEAVRRMAMSIEKDANK